MQYVIFFITSIFQHGKILYIIIIISFFKLSIIVSFQTFDDV